MRDAQPTSYLMGKIKKLPTNIRNKTRLSTFTTSIQHSIGSPTHINQTRKGNKRQPRWKRGNKTVIVCKSIDNVHRKSYRLHQKLLNLMNEFGKTVGYICKDAQHHYPSETYKLKPQ